jgi:hypothetical protein
MVRIPLRYESICWQLSETAGPSTALRSGRDDKG